MANIQAYPTGTPKANDLLLGTSVPLPNTDAKPITNNFSITDISTILNQGTEITKTLTNAEWIALPTTSIQILPGLGANTAIKILSAYIKFNHVSTSFFFNNSLIIGTGASGSVNATNQCVLPTAFEDIDSSDVISLATQNANISLNAPIYIGTPNGSVNSGDGTVTVVLRYQTIK
mgnify:FL=1|tara:strand:- start:102 stop:629 length:528 start_codon:yes stop_codon:yes gene_type:complete